MARPLTVHEDRLFPVDPGIRTLAQQLYAEVADLPIPARHDVARRR